MQKVVLISCVSKKLPYRAMAKDMYISSLFKKNLAYANSLNPDAILILSAKYGLVDLDTQLEPYDLTLNTMSSRQIQEWAKQVIRQLNDKFDLRRDHFVFLAGQKYRRYLLPHLHTYEIPFEGLPIGKQLQALKEILSV